MDATLVVRASLVLAAALAAAPLMRRAAPAARHRYWTLTLAAVLSLPLLAAAIPNVTVAVPSSWQSPPQTRASRTASLPASRREPRPAVPAVNDAAVSWGVPPLSAQPDENLAPARGRFGLSAAAAIGAIWALGSCLAIAALALSMVRARRLSRGAEDIDDATWHDAAREIGQRLGWRRDVRLLMSDRVMTPMAGGVWRPTVFLPPTSRAWPPEHRDIVLAHEIAHLASADPLRHLMTRLAVAFYWFHPLAWIAARQAGIAREQACDAAVIGLGARPSFYAQVLLDLADSNGSALPLVAALPMVHRSLLEIRVMEILKDTRPSARRLLAVPPIAIGLLTFVVAAVQPAMRAAAVDAVPRPAVNVVPQREMPAAAAAPTVMRAADSVATPATPAPVAPLQAADSECWHEGPGGSFRGSLSTSDVGGRTVIYEQIGTRGTTGIIQKTFGDLRLCLVADGVGERGNVPGPSRWVDVATRFVMESRTAGGSVQQLQGDSGRRLTWRVGGRERPLDAAAVEWRDRMLAVLDTAWELSTLYGEASSLRGEISSIRGEQSSLRGEISSLRGHVSSLRGRISSIRGEESSLRGEISSIRGHVSSLRGAISSERGAISSLNAGRYRASDSERASLNSMVARHEAEIARVEQEIRDYNESAKVEAVERRIAALDAAGKVAAVEGEIRAFDLEKKVADVERRIEALDVDGKVAAIEKKIAALDVERRGAELKNRRDRELERLQKTLAAIR